MPGTQAKPKFERKPNREVFVSMSKDGRFCIVKVVESWILPRNYVQTVLGSSSSGAAVETSSPPASELKEKGS